MRKRTVIELLLLLPLLLTGIFVWQRGLSRPPPSAAGSEVSDPEAPRVQDLIRRTPATPSDATPAPSGPPPPPAGPPPPAQVSVQVLEADGTLPTDAVLVFSPDETFYESAPLGQLLLSAEPGLLTLQASATDGVSLRLSEAFTLRLAPGERHTLQIRLPEPAPPVGFPGFALLPGEGYALITNILPGSPAESAGLQPGDAVLAVDGFPTGGLDVEQLETLLIGPHDQPLRLNLVLEHDNGEFEEAEALILRMPHP